MTRAHQRLAQELAVRSGVAVLIGLFDRAVAPFMTAGSNADIFALSQIALGINVPYGILALTGWRRRTQAYGRMLGDVVMMTIGLYIAGGIAAAPYLGVYVIVPLYAGLTLSSVACLLASTTATLAYLAMAQAQHVGWLPAAPAPAQAWSIAAFNLLILNVVAGVTALLSDAYRRSRAQLLNANVERERAYDATARLNAEIQRAARLRVLGEVVAGITHEIRNVLTPALGYLDLLERKIATMPEAMERLEQARKGCQDAVRIVMTTLDMARRPVESRRPIVTADVVATVVGLKRYDLARDRIAIKVDMAAGFPNLVGSAVQLQQVILNLIGNAQDALRDWPGPRRIEVVGRVADRHGVLEVRDSGPGFPAGLLGRGFEPFRTTKPDGTGLGLSISAGIVRELGGELVAANAPHGGAVLRMLFPLAGEPHAPAAVPQTTVGPALAAGR